MSSTQFRNLSLSTTISRTYSIYIHKILLSEPEKAELADLAKCNVAPKDFKNYVYERTGKFLKTKDINNYKSRYATTIKTSQDHGGMLLEQMQTLASQNLNWIIHYEKDEKDKLLFVLFQTSIMRET